MINRDYINCIKSVLRASDKTFRNSFVGEGNENNVYCMAYQCIQELETENLLLKMQAKSDKIALEYRAEVAERMAKQACSAIFTGELNGENWTEKLRDYNREHGSMGYGITPDMLYSCLREIAEKELAEEKEKE